MYPWLEVDAGVTGDRYICSTEAMMAAGTDTLIIVFDSTDQHAKLNALFLITILSNPLILLKN